MTVEERAKQMLKTEELFYDRLEQKIHYEPVFRIKIEMRERQDLVKKRIDLLKEILGL